MPGIKRFWALAVVAAMFMMSTAKATLTVSLVRVPITQAAKTADPNLVGARSYDLMVTQTGEKWNVTTMQLNLGTSGNLSGSFYQSAGALVSHGGHIFQQGFNNTTPQFYDTSFNTTMNDSNRTTILGDSDYPVSNATGTVAIQNGTQLSVAWGDPQLVGANTTGDGSFSIGRITVKGNTGGYLNGYVAGNINLNQKQAFTNVYLPILGDINGDGVVNQTDLNVVTQNFLSTTAPQADFNDDGVVNQTDLNAITQDFLNNLSPPPGAALGSLVPEPGCITALLSVGLLVVRRRQRA